MKIASTQVTKLIFSELSDYPLDPVTVFLDDRETNNLAGGSNQGSVVIECYGKSWAARWGDIGNRSVSKFIQSSEPSYLAGSLEPSLPMSRFSGRALCRMARAKVIERRRLSPTTAGHLTQDAARSLYDAASDLGFSDNIDQAMAHHGDLLAEFFGPEWWHEASTATEPHPDYSYLCRVIGAVQDGLALYDAAVSSEQHSALSSS
ncbi:TPA: hypothetical protein L5U90_003252 [Pseudomonas aeruginosa]|nr:hypothetical protein [Pseudomonas aeruginosa]